jgi:hypothetical protein
MRKLHIFRQHASVNKLLYGVDVIWHEETDTTKVLHLDHSCVWCQNVDTWKVDQTSLESFEMWYDQLDQSSLK